jgi:hypothetical protein
MLVFPFSDYTHESTTGRKYVALFAIKEVLTW